MDLDQELQHHGNEAEACGTQNRTDDIYICQRSGLRRPDEDQVAKPNQGHGDFDIREIEFVSVDDWRGDGGTNQTYDDENGARDPGVVFAEAIGLENLVEQAGDGIEEANKDGIWNEDEVELRAVQESGHVVFDRISVQSVCDFGTC